MAGSEARPLLLLDDAPRTVYDVQELVVDGCVMAMQEFSEDELTALAEEAEKVKADGWLAQMVREYLNVWRDHGERP